MSQVIYAAAAARAGIVEGGLGRQTIYGADGDDIIYADLQSSTGAPVMSVADGARAAGFGALRDPGSIAMTEINGELVFFGADEYLGGGGVAAWTVGEDSALKAVWSQSAMFWLEPVLSGARAVEALRHDGAAWLVTGGWGLSLSRIGADGRPQLMDTIFSDGSDGLYKPGAFSGWSENGKLTVLVGGGSDGGLSRYEWTGAGLSLRQRINDDFSKRLSDVASIETVKIGASRYVLTLSAEDAGLTVWRDAASGLVQTDLRSPADGETKFDLAGATSMVVIPQIGQALVYAATERGMLITYTISSTGKLTRIDEARGYERIAHAKVGGVDMLFASGSDGAVHVLEVGAMGALTHSAALSLGEGAEIGDLAAAQLGETVLLMAARPDAGGFDLIEIAEDGADYVYGGKGDDRIIGGGGADRLLGQGGKDELWGEDDDDLLIGGNDDDSLIGGRGDDELRGGGDDDALMGGDGNDVLKGGAGVDSLFGGPGDDLLRGGLFGDQLRGESGDDVIRAGDGHDDADGGAGDDELYGERGSDTLRGGGGNDFIGGGFGNDMLYGDGGDDELRGADGRDMLWGGAGNDVLKGGRYADKMWGGSEDDFLFGQEGPDSLWGEAGADTLDGGAGADQLNGGTGNDVLKGGGGADLFVFGGDWGRDRIVDFQDGRDMIQFNDGAEDFSDLILVQQGRDVLVHTGDLLTASILIEDVARAELSAADFLFGA